jgi:hypothetical protein
VALWKAKRRCHNYPAKNRRTRLVVGRSFGETMYLLVVLDHPRTRLYLGIARIPVSEDHLESRINAWLDREIRWRRTVALVPCNFTIPKNVALDGGRLRGA